MGEYINIGICTSIKIKNKNFEGETIQSVENKLKSFIDVSLFDMMEFEDYIEFIVKEEVFKPQNVSKFLLEQSKLNGMDKEEEAKDEYEEISKKNNMYEILEYANIDSHYFKTIYNVKKIKVGLTNELEFSYIMCVYTYAGRVTLEYYKDFSMYIEKLIKESSKYKQIASLVKLNIT